MAVLAVIGGIDSRPRLGGLVQLKEWGLGTVSRIAPNGKVTVQCGGQQKAKICSISQVKPVRHWERELYVCIFNWSLPSGGFQG